MLKNIFTIFKPYVVLSFWSLLLVYGVVELLVSLFGFTLHPKMLLIPWVILTVIITILLVFKNQGGTND